MSRFDLGIPKADPSVGSPPALDPNRDPFPEPATRPDGSPCRRFDPAPAQEERIKSNMARCVHFTGLQNKTCEAGVAYESVTLRHAPIDGATVSHPCSDRFNAGGATCPSHQRRTREQAEEREREVQASIARTIKVLVAIREHAATTGNLRGVIDCPACERPKSLGYGIARSDGHIHARCNTPKCVAFMQ